MEVDEILINSFSPLPCGIAMELPLHLPFVTSFYFATLEIEREAQTSLVQ